MESFRPLTGKLVLIIVISVNVYVRRVSFRPLTGKLVLISHRHDGFDILFSLFPSPYGEVGFDQRAGLYSYHYVIAMFPSPYGEVGFDHGKR